MNSVVLMGVVQESCFLSGFSQFLKMGFLKKMPLSYFEGLQVSMKVLPNNQQLRLEAGFLA